MSKPQFSSSSLPLLQSQLATWRRRQVGRPRLPAEFWKAAAVLAQLHGVSHVARTLGIEFLRLRRLADGTKAHSERRCPASQSLSAPGFVELPWPPGVAAKGTERPVPGPGLGSVELISPAQGRLRMELAVDVDLCLRLANHFWSLPS